MGIGFRRWPKERPADYLIWLRRDPSEAGLTSHGCSTRFGVSIDDAVARAEHKMTTADAYQMAERDLACGEASLTISRPSAARPDRMTPKPVARTNGGSSTAMHYKSSWRTRTYDEWLRFR